MFNITATGRLTSAPTLEVHNDTPLCKLSIATSRYTGKDKDGNARNVTDYLDIVVWGKIAETHAKQLGKGHLICATGPLVQERWESPDGSKRSKHVLNANEIEYLAKSRKEADSETEQVPAEAF